MLGFSDKKGRQIIRIPFVKTRFHEKTFNIQETKPLTIQNSQEGRTEKKAKQHLLKNPEKKYLIIIKHPFPMTLVYPRFRQKKNSSKCMNLLATFLFHEENQQK